MDIKSSIMIKCICTIILLLTFSNNLYSVSTKRNIVIHGEFDKNPDSIRLIYQFWTTSSRDISELDTYESIKIKGKEFTINLRANSQISYFSLFDEVSGQVLVGKQYLAPGDSLDFSIKIDGQRYLLNVKGKLSPVITLFNTLDSIKFFIRDSDRSRSEIMAIIDSIRSRKIDILKQHGNILSPSVCDIAEADIYGEAGFKTLQYCFPSYLNLFLNHETLGLDKDSALFDSFVNRGIPLSSEILSNSEEFLNYLTSIVTAKVYRSTGGKPLEFADNIYYILDNFSNPIRDKLLARFFSKVSLFSFYSTGVEPNLFKNLLSKSLTTCKDGHVVKYLHKLYTNNVIGANPFDFNLRVDSSNRKLRLSEIKNKVILIDMWGYTCTGCYLFTKYFHEKIYPEFRSDTNFIVISMMLEATKSNVGHEQYLERLRGGPNRYTFPEYLNVYTGAGETQGDLILDYYTVNAAPFIVLLRDGQIYSTSLPLFTTESSPNIGALRKLIRGLLR